MKLNNIREQIVEDAGFTEQLKTLTNIRLKAPEGFTGAVMQSIYELDSKADALEVRVYLSRLYKNIGTSLIVASVTTILFFSIPKLNFYQSYFPNIVQNGSMMQQTCGIKENLTSVNTNINNLLNSINNAVIRFKEGT